MAAMLRDAMPPIEGDPGPGRDLWPAMRARLNQPADVGARLKSVPWFDWALAGGVTLFAVVFPAAVPVLLYYL